MQDDDEAIDNDYVVVQRASVWRRVVWPIVVVAAIGIAGRYWLGLNFVVGAGVGFFLFAITFRMNSGYWPFQN